MIKNYKNIIFIIQLIKSLIKMYPDLPDRKISIEETKSDNPYPEPDLNRLS